MNKKHRYPGSNPFTRDLKALFFGRDNEIKELSTFINVEKLIILHGKSGLGKSSLLNAGLLPKIEKDHNYFTIPIRFTSYTEDSRLQPVDIAEQKISEFTNRDNFLNKIESENVTLWQHIKNIQYEHKDKKCILLVFDQFEELFTYPEGVDYFAKVLADLMHSRMPKQFRRMLSLATIEKKEFLTEKQRDFIYNPFNLKVIFSIRSDKMYFLDRLSTSIPFVLRNCYELTPLSKEHARIAIVQPAEKEGDYISRAFTYQDEAIKQMLDYLSKQKEKIDKGFKSKIEPFQLQLLCQHLEQLIIDSKNKKTIKKEDLKGEVGMRQIMEKFYDNQIKQLEPKCDRNKARKLCEKGLIMEGWRISQHKKVIEEKYKLSEKALNYLVAKRLLRPETLGAGTIYELSHDTLIEPILKSRSKRNFRKGILITLIVLALISLPSVKYGIPFYNDYRYSNYLDKAYTAIENDMTDEATGYWNDAIKIYPEKSNAYLIAGKTLLAKNSADKATKFLNDAINEVPDQEKPKFYITLGNILLKKKNKEAEAIGYFKKAIELAPDEVDANIYTAVGYALLKQGKEAKAIGYFKKAIDMVPTDKIDINSCLIVGNDFLNQSDENNAIKYYKKIIDFVNKYPNQNKEFDINAFKTDIEGRLHEQGKNEKDIRGFIGKVGFDS